MPKSKTSEKSTGGGNLARSVTVTIRLDPKLKYLTEIAARSQRRTVSSFIEWAIEKSLEHVKLIEAGQFPRDVSVADRAEKLWHVQESARFVYLALLHRELLVHREQLLLQLIEDSGLFNDVFYLGEKYDGWQEGVFHVNWEHVEKYVLPRLRGHWDSFNQVVDGTLSEGALPNWNRESEDLATGKTDS